MSQENRKHHHSRRSRRRRKQLMQRRLIVVSIVIVIAIIAIFLVVKGVSGKKAETKMDTKEVAALDVDDSKPTEEDTTQEEQPQQEVVDDRLNFAVQPGVACGSTEETEEKVVYLTFDDGPSVNTQAVLDILDQYNAKATFFVTNINPDYIDMIKVAYDKGHTIGLHTYSHDYAAVYASVDAYFQDLDAIGQVVASQIGYVPCFIRFPGGSSNTVSANYTSGIMSTLAQEVQNRGYQYYDWNCSSGDGSVRSAEELIAQGTTGTDNNIVFLSHDALSKETTVEALPTIIDFYQSQGYVFKALDRNSYAAHHGINN